MDFDVQELSSEIRQIDQEYRQANDRLAEVYGRGRGRGRGRFRGRGRRHLFQRSSSGNDTGRWNEPEGPAAEPRVASSIVGAFTSDAQRDFIPPVILKRPANHGMDEDPKIKSRNRRMFSSLLGTLEKFKEENETVERSERWKKREEVTKRTLQKTAEESVRLQQKQKKEWEEQKQQETEKLKELDRMRKVKGLQLIYAKRCQHKELLLQYLPADSEPVIYWLPAKHSEETRTLMESHATDHASWMEAQKEKFEIEKERIESGLPLEEEQLLAEEPKIKSTIHIAHPETDALEEEGDMEFQPVSEIYNDPGEEMETPAAKKPRLEQSEGEEKSETENGDER